MKKEYWKEYWNKQTNGQHRSQEEYFLKKESDEKLFHLGEGENLLDFGCGSADLLVYYTQNYKFCVGGDCSKLMLEKASERIKEFGFQNEIILLECDNSKIWENIENKFGNDFKFDCITTGQLVQYLNKNQIEEFINNSLLHLKEDGKICMFDIVDSRLHELWKAGLFKTDSLNLSVITKLFYGRMCASLKNFSKKPAFDLGYAYPPSFFMTIAKKNNLKVYCINSMYYEYRYHIILKY